MTGIPRFLADLDARPQQEAEAELLPCCASVRWAAEVAARRPYPDLATLRAVSAAALDALGWDDVLQALSAHPRIGERAAGDGREARWSRGEQAAATTDGDTAAELVAGNLAYEQRFGHVFLVCATGLSAERVLAALRTRLANDVDTERRVVRAELAAIVELRLAGLVAG